MTQDEQHLQLISIFYYIIAAMAGLLALIPVIHLTIGIALVSGAFPADNGGEHTPEFVGWIFIGVASLLIVLGVVIAVCSVAVARYISRRRHYTFCIVAAALACLFMPLGTILGVFTIIVLSRASVKPLFGVSA